MEERRAGGKGQPRITAGVDGLVTRRRPVGAPGSVAQLATRWVVGQKLTAVIDVPGGETFRACSLKQSHQRQLPTGATTWETRYLQSWW